MPPKSTIAVLYNPKFSAAAQMLSDVQVAANATDMKIEVLQASTDGELDAAFKAISPAHFAALATIADPFFDSGEKGLLLSQRVARRPRCTMRVNT